MCYKHGFLRSQNLECKMSNFKSSTYIHDLSTLPSPIRAVVNFHNAGVVTHNVVGLDPVHMQIHIHINSYVYVECDYKM
jgi:hypothetical protein